MNKVQLSEPGKRLVKLILSLNDSSVDLSYVWNVLLPLLRLVQWSQWEVLFKNNLKVGLMALAKTLVSEVKYEIL